MADVLGILNGNVSGRDTTNVDPKILAIMALRRKQQMGNDPTNQKVDVMADIKAANEGKRTPPIDTSKIKMAHDEWLKRIDEMGYELKKKSQ